MLSQINNKIKTFDQNKTQHNKVIEQILTPDYFLPSSSNAHYYSRKYHGILNLNFKSRIKQVATVSLIFLSMVTGEVFAGDKRPKSKASSGRKQEVTFESINLTSSLPDVVPQLPLPDLIPSNPQVAPTPPPASGLSERLCKYDIRVSPSLIDICPFLVISTTKYGKLIRGCQKVCVSCKNS